MNGAEQEFEDRLALRAARMVLDGEAMDVATAVRRLEGPMRIVRLARRHLDGLKLAAVGPEGLIALRRHRLEETLAVMETIDDLEDRMADDRWVCRGVRVTGRIATGRFDPEHTVHLRHHGDRPLAELEDELECQEIREPFEGSTRTRHGMISSLGFRLESGLFRIHRCPPDQIPLDGPNLLTGEPVAVVDIAGLSRLIADFEG